MKVQATAHRSALEPGQDGKVYKVREGECGFLPASDCGCACLPAKSAAACTRHEDQEFLRSPGASVAVGRAEACEIRGAEARRILCFPGWVACGVASSVCSCLLLGMG